MHCIGCWVAKLSWATHSLPWGLKTCSKFDTHSVTIPHHSLSPSLACPGIRASGPLQRNGALLALRLSVVESTGGARHMLTEAQHTAPHYSMVTAPHRTPLHPMAGLWITGAQRLLHPCYSLSVRNVQSHLYPFLSYCLQLMTILSAAFGWAAPNLVRRRPSRTARGAGGGLSEKEG